MNEAIEDRPDNNGMSVDSTQAKEEYKSIGYRLGRAFFVLMLISFLGFALKVFLGLMWPAS